MLLKTRKPVKVFFETGGVIPAQTRRSDCGGQSMCHFAGDAGGHVMCPPCCWLRKDAKDSRDISMGRNRIKGKVSQPNPLSKVF